MPEPPFSLAREGGASFDILTEIFLRCLPDDEFIRADPRHAPLLLTQVCSYWREVAVLTRALWTSLMISLPERSESDYPCRSNLVREWISRSGSGPLYLALKDVSKGSQDSEQCFSLLAMHISRCKSLKLDIHLYDLNYFRQIEMPLLETLDIMTHGQVHHTDRVIHLFKAAPLLSDVSFDWDYPLAPSSLDIPYAQLTSLSVVNIDYIGEIAEALRGCQQLLYCSLKFADEYDHPGNLDTVCVPKLQTLELEVPDRSLISCILNSLSLPELQTFKLKMDSRYLHGGHQSFLRFLRNNSPSSLEVSGSRDIFLGSPGRFRAFLASVPYVTRLVLSQALSPFQRHADQCFDFLILRHEYDHCFVPRLEVLEITIEDCVSDPTEDVVFRMLRSRLSPPAPSSSGTPPMAYLRTACITRLHDLTARSWFMSDSGEIRVTEEVLSEL